MRLHRLSRQIQRGYGALQIPEARSPPFPNRRPLYATLTTNHEGMRKRLSWRPTAGLRSSVRWYNLSAGSHQSTLVPWRAANKDDVLTLLAELKEDVARGTSATLPQSPLIHSGLMSARDRHRRPKRPPSKQLSLMQLKLRKTPYGNGPSCNGEGHG